MRGDQPGLGPVVRPVLGPARPVPGDGPSRPAGLGGHGPAWLGPGPAAGWGLATGRAYLVDTVIVYVGVILASATLGFVSALLLPTYPAVLDSEPFGWAAFLVIATAYFTLTVACTGQTLGKRLLGLRTVHLDESPPLPGAAFKRALVLTLLSLIPLGLLICAVLMERDRRRQGWHDQAAGTFVISTRAAHRW